MECSLPLRMVSRITTESAVREISGKNFLELQLVKLKNSKLMFMHDHS